MNRNRLLPFLLALLPALAAGEDLPAVRFGTTVFSDVTWTHEPEVIDADGDPVERSEFEVRRAYLNVAAKLTPRLSARVTTDVAGRVATVASGLGTGSVRSTLDGSLGLRLKYAYGQLELGNGRFLRLGQQPTPWLDFTDGIYRYRLQGTSFAEREGLLTSSDVGLSARAERGRLEIHAGLYNGEGYAQPEANDRKALQIRATVRGPSGLKLSGFADLDHPVGGGTRRRFLANAAFQHPRVHAGVDWVAAEDRTRAGEPTRRSQGWSAWVTPRTRFGIEGLLRHDRFQPDRNRADARHRTVVGIAWWPHIKGATAALLLDVERVASDPALARPRETRLALHTLLTL